MREKKEGPEGREPTIKLGPKWSYTTFCNDMDCSLPGFSVHGILQARILEWVAMPSSRGSSEPRKQTQVSCTAGRFFTNWTTKEFFPQIQALGCVTCSVMSDPLRPYRLDPARLLCPGDSPVKNTGMGCHFLLQGSFQPRESNLGLLNCRQILYCLSHQVSLGVWWTQVIMVSDPLLLQVSNLMPEMFQGPDPWGSAGGACVIQPSTLLCTLFSPTSHQ